MTTADDLYSFANLWRQYRLCRRNKRNTINALAFEVDAEANLLALQAELREHSYRPGRSICFITDGAKPREVFAADFRDRVVHHLLVSAQTPVFERRFIHDSYACRVGKGTLAASNRLMSFLCKVSANGARGAWALKLDVADFFPSIRKRTLYDIIERAIRDPELRWLSRVLLFHDPTGNYRFQSRGKNTAGPGHAGYPVLARKSLFGNDNVHGLPIGNLTSQFWGNVYLDQVDQFVKRTLGCRYYVRYVDDMILLARSRDQLRRWRERIALFLRGRLGLELKAGQREFMPVRGGVEYIGWFTWWNHRIPHRRTLGRLRSSIAGFEGRVLKRAFEGQARRIDLGACAWRAGSATSRRDHTKMANIERLRATLASYSGHLRHGASWRAWARMWEAAAWLVFLFDLDGWQISARWPPAALSSAPRFRVQYGRLLRGATDRCLVFWRVGRFVEFYGPQRLLAQRRLGLRCARLARYDHAFRAGFPVWLTPRYAQRALAAGSAVVLVAEQRAIDGDGFDRVPTTLLLPYSRRTRRRGRAATLPGERASGAPYPVPVVVPVGNRKPS